LKNLRNQVFERVGKEIEELVEPYAPIPITELVPPTTTPHSFLKQLYLKGTPGFRVGYEFVVAADTYTVASSDGEEHCGISLFSAKTLVAQMINDKIKQGYSPVAVK
jgi:hypothetical protein